MITAKRDNKNRLFVAIDLSNQSDLSQLIRNFKQSLVSENLHWTKEKNLHLSLKFIGSASENQEKLIDESLQLIAKKTNTFEIDFGSIGVFGSTHDPRVLWLGVKPSAALLEFQQLIADSLVKLGVKAEIQNFIPHITLARNHHKIKSKDYFQKVINHFQHPKLSTKQVNEFCLFNSVLTKEGPTYQIKSNYSLNP